MTRVKYLARYVNGHAFKPDDWSDTGKPILRIQNLSETQAPFNRFEGELPDQYIVRQDDILISWSGSLGVYKWTGEEAWLNQHIFKVVVNEKLVLRGYFLWLAMWFIGELESKLHGSTMQHLTLDAFGNFKVPLPSFSTQHVLAHYLDRETAKVDAMIDAKERLLKLLDEKRSALIMHVVTRGLNTDAPLCDSGVEWLGKIPAHWEVRRLAYLFRERDEREQPDLPLLVVSIHNGVSIREFSDEHIEQVAEDFSTYKVARKGDISFNKMRMWQGAVGKVPVDGLVSPDYVVATPIADIDSAYYGELFRCPQFSAEAARWSHGIVWDRMRLYWDEFRDISVPIPPIEEQHAIMACLAIESSKLDALRVATERSIELLRERRGALISEAITGKTPRERLQCLSIV